MKLRYAIPLQDGVLSGHFGHSELFVFIDVDSETKAISDIQRRVPPPHAPGVLPAWLLENGTTVAIVGGMGMKARQMLEEKGVRVVTGAPAIEPEKLVRQDLAGALTDGDNTCHHGPEHVCKNGHGQDHDHPHDHGKR